MQNVKSSLPSLGPAFISRVYGVTVGLTLVVVLCLIGRVEGRWIISFLLGDALGLGLLKSNEVVTGALMRRRPKKGGRWVMLIQVAKYPFVAAFLYLAIVVFKFSPLALLCGYVLIQAGILLTVAGRMLTQSMGRRVHQERRKARGE